MEITKFRLQLSTALEQVKVRLWRVRYRFRKLRRIAAVRVRRLGHKLRPRENALRGLLAARSRKAIVAGNSKISKAKAQVSIAFEGGTAPLRQARNRLARLKRSIAAKRQKLAEERRARERQKPPKELPAWGNELRLLETRPREAIVGAGKITKAKGQLQGAPGAPAALEQWTAHLLQTYNPLAGLARSIAEKPPKLAEELPARELQKPPEEVRARRDELYVQVARPREAVVAADSKSAKVEAQLPIASKKGTARLRQVQKTLSGLGRNIAAKRRRKRQELGARESEMHDLLASSVDAIVVISGDHRFVTANRRALDLFGVSERNLSKFNIDAFLSCGQIPDFHRNGAFFKGRQERHGKCTIRRLDGSLRVAEFALVTDFLPLHLYRFYDLCMPQWPTPIQHRIGPGPQDVSHAGQAH